MTTLTATLFQVTVGGSPLEASAAHAITRILVMQRLSAPTLCELTFVLGALQATRPTVEVGAELSVRVPGHDATLFEGELTAVSHRHLADGTLEVRARGYDALHQFRRARPRRVHAGVTAAALARELCGPAGLEVEAEAEGPPWSRILQHRHSDLDLLAGVAGACGLWFTLDGNRLHLLTPAGTGELVELELGKGLIEVGIEANSGAARASVETIGWDALTAQARRGRCDAWRCPFPRPSWASDELSLTDLPVTSDELASAAAEAEMDRCAAGAQWCSGIADGRPELRPGARVVLRGVGAGQEGEYMLTSTTHRIGPDEGYTTEFSTLLPAIPALDCGPAVALGRVTSVDDPDGLGRIRVTLPSRGDLESEWMQAVAPGAGKGKGLIALPDVGDLVVVLFTAECTGQGVVLGGVFGHDAPPDGKPNNAAIDRYVLMTRGGQTIALDDSAKSIRVSTRDGAYVEFKPDQTTVHAQTRLVLEAPGGRVQIRADRVDFERA